MQRHWVPLAPFRRLMLEWLEQQDGDESRIEQLATLVDIDRRQVYRLLHEDGKECIEFDVADAIVTRVVGPMAWYTNDDLAEIYQSVNLNALDWRYPTCSKVVGQLKQKARRALESRGTVTGGAKSLGISPGVLEKFLPQPPHGRVAERRMKAAA